MRGRQFCPSLLVLASSNDSFKRYNLAPAFIRHSAVHEHADLVRRTKLHLAGHMGIGVQREAGAAMDEHAGQGFHIDDSAHRECVESAVKIEKAHRDADMLTHS